jgi:hypothetical protein
MGGAPDNRGEERSPHRPGEEPAVSHTQPQILQVLAATAAVIGLPIAIARIPFEHADVTAGLVAVAMVVGGLSVWMLKDQRSHSRRTSIFHVALIVAASALGGAIVHAAWNGAVAEPGLATPAAPTASPSASSSAEPCKSTGSFVSPRPDQTVSLRTKIEGRARLCDGDSLWVTAMSDYGHVSRTDSPIKPDEQGNWTDPRKALLGQHPPPRVTYCLIATDKDATQEWLDRFDAIGDGGTLDLRGLPVPQLCLDQVSVSTER